MVRFCAHIGYQFTELPFFERFSAAAAAGFRAVEFPAPYAFSARELARALRDGGLSYVQFALPMGRASAGEKGIGCHPGRRDELDEGIALAIDYARSLDCRLVHAMAGILPDGHSREEGIRTYVDNLRRVADRLEPHGITVLLEPINSLDVPGYLVDRPSLALSILDTCARPNIRLLFDAYHSAVMAEDPVYFVRAHAARIGHVQVADYPGRHEPGTGSIDFSALFDALDTLGYTGWIGCEYKPAGRTTDGLGWRARWS
jgi:hydroxypyruvate isomerase